MWLSLDNVRERLLRTGLAPGHVRRYVAELQEHLADLVAREQAAGMDATQAQQRAASLLGSEAQLVQGMIDSGAPRALAARAPWSVFAVAPVLLLMALAAATGASMMHLLAPLRGLAPADFPSGYASLIAAVSFVTSYLVGPLLAAGCIIIALRQRLASPWVWVGLALIALLSAVFGFHMHVVPDADGGRGQVMFAALAAVYEHGRPDPTATLNLVLLRAAVLFGAAATAYGALRARLTRPDVTLRRET